MVKRDLSKDATLTLPGITRPVGRPRTGKARSSAERMRAYRERRQQQESEFPSLVTGIQYQKTPFVREEYSFSPPPSGLPVGLPMRKGAPDCIYSVVAIPRPFREVIEAAYLKFRQESGDELPFSEFLGLVVIAGVEGF